MFLMCSSLCRKEPSDERRGKIHKAVVVFLRVFFSPSADGKKKNKIQSMIGATQIVIKDFTRENIVKL